MRTSSLQPVIQHLRKAVLIRDGAGLTDGQLLTLFIEQRDQAAFEALVKRHGPMVMGVCRRLLRNPQDSEDAFQATFLVLVRKAAAVVPREMIANWLYGVARTTALRANALVAQRRKRERQVREMPEPETMQSDLWQDLRPLLDQELSRLPDKYRVAIVLCDLEGKSHKEAARQLGWPIGTLSGRLARARKLLADRLRRHGLVVSGGVLTGLLSQHGASASVPASLVSSTVKAASLLAAGQAAVAGLVSMKAAALTEGVVITMLLNKLKVMAMVFLITTVVGGAGLLYRSQAAEAGKDAPVATDAGRAEESPLAGGNTEAASSEPSSRNLLSSNPMPRPAAVSLDKGQLVVRTLDVVYEPTAILFQGQTRTSYQKAEILKTKHFDLTIVKVYDVRGKSVPKRELPRLLKKETVALVSTDQQAVDPLNLHLFKDGTLLFLLPALPPPPVAPGAGVSYAPARPSAAVAGAATGYVDPPAVGSGAKVAPPTGPLPSATAVLQEDPEVLVVHARTVPIPVHVASDQRAAVQHLHLYASTDKGKTWERVSTIPADRDSFVFQAPGLGLYWFVVQVVRRDGKTDPSDLGETVRPQLKVLIKSGEER